MKQGSAWWRYFPSPSPWFHSTQQSMVILLGRHSPRKSYLRKGTPPIPHKLCRLGVPKSKSVPRVGYFRVQQVAQEPSEQHFCGVLLVSASPFLSIKIHMWLDLSGADQLSQELRRLHGGGGGGSGEKTAIAEMEKEKKSWSLARDPIVHLVTGKMFIEYLLCAAHHIWHSWFFVPTVWEISSFLYQSFYECKPFSLF